MKKFLLPVLALSVALAACVDTTGLSPQSSRTAYGNPNSAVVLTEFGDFQCPACKSAQTNLVKPIKEKYGAQIRFEFRHFPLRSVHRYALDLAEASECAADQGKFWEFVDMAYDKQAELKKGSWDEWAKALGMDTELFGRCWESHIKKAGILDEYNQGVALGVKGTPTFYVNGVQTEATMESLSKALDAALAGAMQRL